MRIKIEGVECCMSERGWWLQKFGFLRRLGFAHILVPIDEELSDGVLDKLEVEELKFDALGKPFFLRSEIIVPRKSRVVQLGESVFERVYVTLSDAGRPRIGFHSGLTKAIQMRVNDQPSKESEIVLATGELIKAEIRGKKDLGRISVILLEE